LYHSLSLSLSGLYGPSYSLFIRALLSSIIPPPGHYCPSLFPLPGHYCPSLSHIQTLLSFITPLLYPSTIALPTILLSGHYCPLLSSLLEYYCSPIILPCRALLLSYLGIITPIDCPICFSYLGTMYPFTWWYDLTLHLCITDVRLPTSSWITSLNPMPYYAFVRLGYYKWISLSWYKPTIIQFWHSTAPLSVYYLRITASTFSMIIIFPYRLIPPLTLRYQLSLVTLYQATHPFV
jgi:hypothetical protein